MTPSREIRIRDGLIESLGSDLDPVVVRAFGGRLVQPKGIDVLIHCARPQAQTYDAAGRCREWIYTVEVHTVAATDYERENPGTGDEVVEDVDLWVRDTLDAGLINDITDDGSACTLVTEQDGDYVLDPAFEAKTTVVQIHIMEGGET